MRALQRLISSMQGAATVIYPPELKGYWKGEGNANDSTTNANHGTAQSQSAFNTGFVGNAFEFNGNFASRIVIPSINVGGTYSWEFYVYQTNAIGTAQHLISNIWTSAANYGALYLDSNRKVSYYRNSANVGASTLPVPINTWTKVLFTYDGSRVRIWINGIPTFYETGTHAETFNNAVAFGDALVLEAAALNGRLDEVKLFNNVQDGQRGVIAYYAGENNGTDSQNGLNLTLGSAPSYAAGFSGNGFNFTGSTTQVPRTPALYLEPSYSIDFYMKPSNANPGATFYHVISNAFNSSSYGALYYTGTNRLEYWQNGALKVASPNNSISNAAFQRVTLQYDSTVSKTKIYIAGALVATEAGTHTEKWVNQDCRIGYGGESNVFTGVIDEVKFYNKLLL